MLGLHRALAVLLVAVGAVFTVSALLAAQFWGARAWLEWFRRTALVLIGIEVGVGAILYGTGHRPDESLHILYGAAALALIPFGSRFASEAPPRPRAFVLGVAGLLTVGVLFRSFMTG